MRIIGLDPGLRHTGWGIIIASGSRLSLVAAGTVNSTDGLPLQDRLLELHDGLDAVMADQQPDAAAVEETFVNRNADATMKLGMARAVALLIPARAGIPVAEYPTKLVKKSVVGTGNAEKEQVQMMVRMLLGAGTADRWSADAADALAVAICHAHHAGTTDRVAAGDRVAGSRASGGRR